MKLDHARGDPGAAERPRRALAVAVAAFAAFWAAQVAGTFVVHAAVAFAYAARGHDVADPAIQSRMAGIALPAGVLFGVLGSALAVGLIARAGLGDRLRRDGPDGLGWSLGAPAAVGRAVLGAAAVCAVSQSLAYAITPPAEAELSPLVEMATRSALGFAVLALVGVMIAPPVEELLFRGLLLHGLTRRLGVSTSAVLVTLLFAVSHLPEAVHYPPGMIGITALAAYAVWLRLRTGSLGPAIAAHATYNALLISLLGLGLLGTRLT